MNLTPKHFGRLAAVAALCLGAGVVGVPPPAGVSAQRPHAASSTSPNRILDTRTGLGATIAEKIEPGTTLVLSVPGAKAAGATSVALNLTATEADGPGWVRVWSCGHPEPSTSSLNFVPGRISANMVVVELGGPGVCITTYAPVHLVADLAGWFTGSDDFIGTSPSRIVDTRNTGDPLVGGGAERRIPIAGIAGSGVPGGATLVAINLTVDAPPADGWVVAYSCGQPTNSSTLNFSAGETVAGLSFVGLGQGAICLRSWNVTNVIVDAVGFSRGKGQLQVQPPQRLLDTRNPATWPFGAASSGAKVAVRVAGTGRIPNDAAAALLTVTVAGATGDGFVTVWPCDQPLPSASTINTWVGQLRSNLALVHLAADGTACLQVSSLRGTPLELVLDAIGWESGGVARPNLPTNPIAPLGGSSGAPPTVGTASLPIASGPAGAPGCGLASAAFCETFDASRNGGTQTGDLDPVVWGVSRLGDINPGTAANGIVASTNACSVGAVPPPADVRICGGKLLESVNDGGGVSQLNTYPKQPFSFGGRTGKVAFDVGADSQGSHAAWPEFVITDKPVPGVRRSISFGTPPHAQNSIGFSIDGCAAGASSTTGIGAVFYTINGVYHEVSGVRPNCITAGSTSLLNHIEVRISTTRIEVWGTDAGAPTLKQLAVEDIPGGLAFNQGLVWLDDVHYNARKAIEPCICGPQFDHSFAWDNLGFDGPKTYRDGAVDVPYSYDGTSTSINGDPEVEVGYNASDNRTFTLEGVVVPTSPPTSTPVAAQVVLNAYSFDPTQPTVSVNGGPAHTIQWVAGDVTYAWRSMSIPIPIGEVRAGMNTLRITGSSSTVLSNISLVVTAAAAVP